LEKRNLITVTGDILNANWFVVLAEGLDMFRLKPISSGRNMDQSGNLYFTKRTLGGCLGVEPRRIV
jgi:hypothetical protein